MILLGVLNFYPSTKFSSKFYQRNFFLADLFLCERQQQQQQKILHFENFLQIFTLNYSINKFNKKTFWGKRRTELILKCKRILE